MFMMKTDFPKTNSISASAPVNSLPSKSLAKLVFSMVSPYKKWHLIIFLAMLVETTMSLATPWPLKIIIDNVIGHHKLPHFLAWMDTVFPAENRIQFAAVAAISMIMMAAIGSLASYLDNY